MDKINRLKKQMCVVDAENMRGMEAIKDLNRNIVVVYHVENFAQILISLIVVINLRLKKEIKEHSVNVEVVNFVV